jgi:L-cystine uptake protein TcyP (sodium:dicarboxylate symporter family)
MDFDFAAFPAIAIICYFIAEIIKLTPLDKKWLPTIVGVVGGILGVVGKLTIADFPAADMLSAIAVGIVSGLASTGANQIYKQLTKTDTNK